MKTSESSTGKKQGGASMIEVLVTIVVVSLGLLGYAGLLANAQKSNLTAYWHGQATILADSITECMRANRTVATSSAAYNISIGTAASGNTLAQSDLARWKSALSASLPTGDGSVSIGLNGKATITIQWLDASGNAKSLVTETQL